MLIGLLANPVPNDGEFSDLHAYQAIHFYQVTLEDPAFLDHTIDTGQYKRLLKGVIRWKLADLKWIKQSLSHPQFIQWTSARATGLFVLGLDDLRQLVLEYMVFFKEKDQMRLFLNDLLLHYIPLMGLAADLAPVVNLVVTFHQHIDTDPPSLKAISERIHSSWPEEKVLALMSELLGTNYIAVFDSLALNQESKIEARIQDWIYSPSQLMDSRSPGKVLQFAFKKYGLSKDLGSQVLGLSLLRGWTPTAYFMLQHSKYHNGLDGDFLVDVLRSDRISIPVKQEILASDLSRAIPKEEWPIILLDEALSDPSSLFGDILRSKVAMEHMTMEDLRIAYMSISEDAKDRSHKAQAILSAIATNRHIQITPQDVNRMFQDSILDKNYEATLQILLEPKFRSYLLPVVYKEYMGQFLKDYVNRDGKAMMFSHKLRHPNVWPVIRDSLPWIDWSLIYPDVDPPLERGGLNGKFGSPSALQALPVSVPSAWQILAPARRVLKTRVRVPVVPSIRGMTGRVIRPFHL
jgi:hypothetical protein